MKNIYWGNSQIQRSNKGGEGEIVQRDGEPYYKISNYQDMTPFFITVVSGTEHWMYLSSNGGLTCGRRSPDNALFPYYTDDKIHEGSSTTGSKTVLLLERGDRTYLWQPFIQGVATYSLERNLYKNLTGTRLAYEEINHDFDLAFSYCWSSSERFGFVKTSRIRNLGDTKCNIDLMDGLCNLLPYGVTRQTQNELSTLLDAYKQAERVKGMTAGIYGLSSILTDKAEPSEALKATVVWSRGLDGARVLLSEDQLPAFSRGQPVHSEDLARGKRGAFFVQSAIAIAPGSEKSWQILADINQGPSQLQALLRDINQGVNPEAIESDIHAGEQRLLQLVGGSDGCQFSSDTLVMARHFSNTLFNIMRGGTFYDGYSYPGEDFLGFVETWNTPLRETFSSLLESVNGPLTLASVLSAAEHSGKADLERLALEYLPLTFSRRHGDPSRPWNQFSIDIKNADGSGKLHFQGNWRDIFQNWEALSLSYPEYIESFIAKFVNASTADGYNPYRITRDGIDWEVLEPENSWSNIGYWGDHQINYLLKFLELSRNYHPGKIATLLTREIFAYANVPYRIKPYSDLLDDPRNSVIYDDSQEALIARRVEAQGSDGKLLGLPDGSVYKVNLLEKLLVTVLAKVGNFVPGGGIWMNTQRPEWNDANNALVGYGLSMVTLCYLRRFLVLLDVILDEDPVEEYSVSVEVSDYFEQLCGVLSNRRSMLDGTVSAEERKGFMDDLGKAAEAYRESVYAGFSSQKFPIEKSALRQFIEQALQYFNHSIMSSSRADGLFHSYNLIRFGPDAYEVENLYEMLEGQVAVLSSGNLGPGESLELLNALRSSEIYRSNQNSYMLYPDRKQRRFLDKNVIDSSLVEGSAWIRRELKTGRRDFVEQDVEGNVHFNVNFRNVGDLAAALERHAEISREDVLELCDVYENVFRHRQFTGRSGSMFKYEGLGSIYWHMVSKLLLAAAEVIDKAVQSDTDEGTLDQLVARFEEIKDGLGVHKPPALYGAFPTDPYSHTPGFTGVQQPGMTGQVKEDVITRFFELGVKVENGRISFAPSILKREEFLAQSETWKYSLGGPEQVEELEKDSLAFTICAVPVIYRLAQDFAIRVFDGDGSHENFSGNQLGRGLSQAIFRRDGRVSKIVVDIPGAVLR